MITFLNKKRFFRSLKSGEKTKKSPLKGQKGTVMLEFVLLTPVLLLLLSGIVEAILYFQTKYQIEHRLIEAARETSVEITRSSGGIYDFQRVYRNKLTQGGAGELLIAPDRLSIDFSEVPLGEYPDIDLNQERVYMVRVTYRYTPQAFLRIFTEDLLITYRFLFKEEMKRAR